MTATEHAASEHADTEHEADGAPGCAHGHGAEGQAAHAHHAAHAPRAEHEHHDHHACHDPAIFKGLFWWNLLLAVPVLVFSEQIQDWFNYDIDGGWAAWVAPTIGTVIYVWGGRPFLTGGVEEVASRRPGMMLLIGLAITVAYGSSLASSLGWGDLDYWWELAALIVVMLLGHWQEMKAISQAQNALDALAELLPDTAERVTSAHSDPSATEDSASDPSVSESGASEHAATEQVPTADLVVGDVVLVRPGGRVPADGVIVEGHAAFDESMITGESVPVTRGEGDPVTAGTVSTDNPVRVRVEAVGDDSALAGIQRLVAAAQSSQSRVLALADRAAAVLFYVATGAAVVTLAAWLLAGDGNEAVIRTVTVLVIACPHALGLAIPLVVSIATATSARVGILVKDRLALERMRTVDVVLFDKTGTLTKGNHAVIDAAPAEGTDRDAVVRLAAAVEADSEHPIARAIVAAGAELGDVPTATALSAHVGKGVEGIVDGTLIAVGGPALRAHLGAAEPPELAAAAQAWRERGATVLYVLRDATIIGALALADEIRPESRVTVDALHSQGTHVALITGDAQQVADGVAAELGIDEVFAEVLPQDKDAKVAELQGRGRKVAMVGDGVNDAAALARADVGIAIGAGTDVAIESAGVVLASSDPRALLGVIKLSKATYTKMVQNLIWATAYNLGAIPIAAGAFAFAGFNLPPAVAAIAMSASTMIVAANAQLLRRLNLRPTPLAGPPAPATGVRPSASSRANA